MSAGTTQNFDEKVQEDFLFYLEHFKEAFDGLKSEIDKEICKVIIIFFPNILARHIINIII